MKVLVQKVATVIATQSTQMKEVYRQRGYRERRGAQIKGVQRQRSTQREGVHRKRGCTEKGGAQKKGVHR